MWAFNLAGPGRIGAIDTPTPDFNDAPPGSVFLRVLATGVCGSDLTPFRHGAPQSQYGDAFGGGVHRPGFPMHEVVGEVIDTKHPGHAVNSRVVGWASNNDAMAEFCISSGDGLATFNPELSAANAITLQPLACVLYALDQIPNIEGAHVAVLGLGPIGLLFCHASKTKGARKVTGVDLVDRRDVATSFGIDDVVCSSTRVWAAQLGQEKPDIVIEAIGHQVSTLIDAVDAAASNGTIYYFGIPDDEYYPFPMVSFLLKNLTFLSGVTLNRQAMLVAADQYVKSHPSLPSTYVTSQYDFGVQEVQKAFDVAIRPSTGRIKIVISTENA